MIILYIGKGKIPNYTNVVLTKCYMVDYIYKKVDFIYLNINI